MAERLIKQADYLIFKQLQTLEENFINEGGFSERMMRVRKERRGY
ncbi:MAG: four helix bundle suffix domain-containing protein [Prevotella sp.]|nr:four helix bundle suffix domain-containing protein [Prevotella sp.]